MNSHNIMFTSYRKTGPIIPKSSPKNLTLSVSLVQCWYSALTSMVCFKSCLVLFFSCVLSSLLALRLPPFGKKELILVLFIRLFDLLLFCFVCFLFLLVSVKVCGLWLWHSLDIFYLLGRPWLLNAIYQYSAIKLSWFSRSRYKVLDNIWAWWPLVLWCKIILINCQNPFNRRFHAQSRENWSSGTK